MLARSASVRFFRSFHGMGGRMALPVPLSLPVRMVLVNWSCVQAPIPVAESGVRFAAKLTPHGPLQAVMVMLPAAIQGGMRRAGAGIGIVAGWPERSFVISGPGPCPVMVHGVWQSLQPMVLTRYLPCSAVAALAVVFEESEETCISDFEVQPAANATSAIAEMPFASLEPNRFE